MKKRTKLLIIILCLPLLIAAKTTKGFQIEGVRGKLLTNIQERLNELAQNKSLGQESETELRNQIEKAMTPFGFFNPTINISYSGNKIILIIRPGQRLL